MYQKTIRYPVSIQGIGLHTGDTCTVKLSPSLPNTGITFYLNSNKGKRIICSDAFKVINPVLSTNIGDEDIYISTIEHLMAALHAWDIDNIEITVIGDEIPILDGSCLPFFNLIESAGVVEQEGHFEKELVIKYTQSWKDGKSSIFVMPSDWLEIHMTVEFDHPAIGNQTCFYTHSSMKSSTNWFRNDYAPARTFGFLDQIEKAKESGLIKGGSLDNAIVLDKDSVINPPLRMNDEFVRHKLVDFLGDLYVVGKVLGHFSVCCSGHRFNNSVIRSILQELI
jgi:UDP-3-O-[3-hydroxymyristoyl] N-acetylglucosamine deacetylase